MSKNSFPVLEKRKWSVKYSDSNFEANEVKVHIYVSALVRD